MSSPPRNPGQPSAAPPGGDLIGDLFAMVGLPNPITSVATTMEQMRRGSEDFLVAVETFTRTMENVNETAMRLNRLLDDVEGPIRAVAPAMSALPSDLSDVVKLLGEVARRLAPLGQLAESAGGMFGLRGFFPSRTQPAPAPPPPAPTPTPEPARTTTRKSAPKKAPVKKTTAKKSTSKKAAAKKTAAKQR